MTELNIDPQIIEEARSILNETIKNGEIPQKKKDEYAQIENLALALYTEFRLKRTMIYQILRKKKGLTITQIAFYKRFAKTIEEKGLSSAKSPKEKQTEEMTDKSEQKKETNSDSALAQKLKAKISSQSLFGESDKTNDQAKPLPGSGYTFSN